VRVSDIKPGMMQKFLEAVTAQEAWYKKAGTPRPDRRPAHHRP
jgi:hypothetical protein